MNSMFYVYVINMMISDKVITDLNQFEYLPDQEKFVNLLNNNQKEVIIFLVKSMTRRRQLLYNHQIIIGLVPSCLFPCLMWHISPVRAGWPSRVTFCCCMYVYMYATCHGNKDVVMLCYVMFYKRNSLCPEMKLWNGRLTCGTIWQKAHSR